MASQLSLQHEAPFEQKDWSCWFCSEIGIALFDVKRLKIFLMAGSLNKGWRWCCCKFFSNHFFFFQNNYNIFAFFQSTVSDLLKDSNPHSLRLGTKKGQRKFWERRISMICLCSKYVKNCNIFGQILNIWVKLILKKKCNSFFNV